MLALLEWRHLAPFPTEKTNLGLGLPLLCKPSHVPKDKAEAVSIACAVVYSASIEAE